MGCVCCAGGGLCLTIGATATCPATIGLWGCPKLRICSSYGTRRWKGSRNQICCLWPRTLRQVGRCREFWLMNLPVTLRGPLALQRGRRGRHRRRAYGKCEIGSRSALLHLFAFRGHHAPIKRAFLRKLERLGVCRPVKLRLLTKSSRGYGSTLLIIGNLRLIWGRHGMLRCANTARKWGHRSLTKWGDRVAVRISV